jgi:hypothetical protein
MDPRGFWRGFASSLAELLVEGENVLGPMEIDIMVEPPPRDLQTRRINTRVTLESDKRRGRTGERGKARARATVQGVRSLRSGMHSRIARYSSSGSSSNLAIAVSYYPKLLARSRGVRSTPRVGERDQVTTFSYRVANQWGHSHDITRSPRLVRNFPGIICRLLLNISGNFPIAKLPIVLWWSCGQVARDN